jgi:hypothetical protein
MKAMISSAIRTCPAYFFPYAGLVCGAFTEDDEIHW